MSEQPKNYAEVLCQAFDIKIKRDYGAILPPPPNITPTGIRTLDALLGGGVVSSHPICLSSSPETGKSTFSYQLAACFLRNNPNAVAVYLDIENAGNADNQTTFNSRIDSFGIDRSRFMYKSVVADLEQVFKIIEDFIELKVGMKQKTGTELELLVVWDSLASTRVGKVDQVDDVNSIIGLKARQLGFLLDKHKPKWAMNKVTLIIIDQIRTNLKIEGPFVKRDENSVGDFNNLKAATGCVALQHSYAQWLFLSKGTALTSKDGMGVEGWEINMHIEKNKLKPSQFNIGVVFDKKFGIIPLLSEYLFMSQMTKFEIKVTGKTESKLSYPLCVITSGHSKIIQVINPETGEVEEESAKFKERNLIQTYNSDPEFRRIFDKALNYSIQQRIEVALFRDAVNMGLTETIDEVAEQQEFVPQL